MEYNVTPMDYCRVCAGSQKFSPAVPDGVSMTSDPKDPKVKVCQEHREWIAQKIQTLWALADVKAVWLDEILNPPTPEPESDGETSAEATPTGTEPFEYEEPEGVQGDGEQAATLAGILGDLGEGEPEEPETPQAEVKEMEKTLLPDVLTSDGKDVFKDWRKAKANGKPLSPRASNDDKREWAASLTPQQQTKYVKSWK